MWLDIDFKPVSGVSAPSYWVLIIAPAHPPPTSPSLSLFLPLSWYRAQIRGKCEKECCTLGYICGLFRRATTENSGCVCMYVRFFPCCVGAPRVTEGLHHLPPLARLLTACALVGLVFDTIET